MLNPTTKTLLFSNRFRMGFHCCLWTLMGWSWTMSCFLYSERCDKDLSDLNFSTQSIYLSFALDDNFSYIRRLRLQDEKVSKFCPGAALSVLVCKTPASLPEPRKLPRGSSPDLRGRTIQLVTKWEADSDKLLSRVGTEMWIIRTLEKIILFGLTGSPTSDLKRILNLFRTSLKF